MLLVATSCGTLTRERTTLVGFADYTAYQDMWISPNDCPLQHKALGSLHITIVPAILPRERTTSRDAIYNSIGGVNYEVIESDELLAMAVAEARARGANGISNLSIKRNDLLYEVTGLLVRIE